MRLLLLTLILFGCAEKKYNSWHKYALKGKVKTLLERKYPAENKNNEWVKYSGRLLAEEKSTYNESGYSKEYYHFDNSSEPITSQVIYDKNNILKEIKNFDKSNNLTSTQKYKIKGDSLKFITYDSAVHKISRSYSILKNGRLTKIFNHYFNHSVSFSIEIERNKNGLIIKEESFENDSLISTDTYKHTKFDDKGNWVERLTFSNGSEEPKLIDIREIEYYE